MKKIPSTNPLIFNFAIVPENFIKIDSLVTYIQNFGEDVCFILYVSIFCKKYEQYQKESSVTKEFYFLTL